jgi:hypothetical protein
MVASPKRTRRRGLSVLCGALALAVLCATLWTPGAAAATKPLTVVIADEDAADAADLTPHGRVTSTPAGIACPPTCSADVTTDSPSVLRATPAAGYAFASWNLLGADGDCRQAPTCSITARDDANPVVTAYFRPAAQLHLATAGPGSLTIAPVQPGREGPCRIDQEQPDSGGQGPCTQRFASGTRVTLTAVPDAGARFFAWSDYGCSNASRTCTLTLTAGERFITARFSPVVLLVRGGGFGAITIRPAPGAFCAMMADSPPCTAVYRPGTVVTLHREHPFQPTGDDTSLGRFWIGPCEGNRNGELDADVCRLRLQGNEAVGAGYNAAGAVPPPLGQGIRIVLGGTKRGTVTGTVITNPNAASLNCGTRCTVTGLNSYDTIRLRAKARKGSRFTRWSDGSTLTSRLVPLSAYNRMKATFARR